MLLREGSVTASAARSPSVRPLITALLMDFSIIGAGNGERGEKQSKKH